MSQCQRSSFKSHTVPCGVAAAKFLCTGLASRLPTAKICDYSDRTLDNVPGTVHLDEVCRRDEVLRCLIWLGGGEIEFRILRHVRGFGHDLEWVVFRWVRRRGPVQWSNVDCLWDG